MKNLIDKMLKRFYTSWLGNLYFEYLLWQDRKNSIEEFSTDLSTIEINITKENYEKALKKIKTKVNEKLIRCATTEEAEKLMIELNELLQYATKTQDVEKIKMIETMKLAYVYRDKDIRTDTDKAKMIEKRIGHFKELHCHIEKRKLLRKIRKAEKEKNLELLSKLKEEWAIKYAGFRRN
jgi:hypothetical protein